MLESCPMKIREFENLILSELKQLIENILQNNININISANSRAGAEVSDWLENMFTVASKNNSYFEDAESAPKGSTKNPWDARTKFKLGKISEEIWIDFKAFKLTSSDSNPDIGTPNKIFTFIENGNFYHVFIYVFYEATETGLQFVKLNGEFTKLYFLKDINKTFRRNPKNQLQINIKSLPEYRSRAEFIKLLISKIRESHQRQISISNKALSEIDGIEKQLLEANESSENNLIKNLQ